MATETNVDATAAFAELTKQGAVTTQVIMIQHDPENNLFNCSLVARGFDAGGQQLGEDQLLCPPPCRIGGAFNPASK